MRSPVLYWLNSCGHAASFKNEVEQWFIGIKVQVHFKQDVTVSGALCTNSSKYRIWLIHKIGNPLWQNWFLFLMWQKNHFNTNIKLIIFIISFGWPQKNDLNVNYIRCTLGIFTTPPLVWPSSRSTRKIVNLIWIWSVMVKENIELIQIEFY